MFAFNPFRASETSFRNVSNIISGNESYNSFSTKIRSFKNNYIPVHIFPLRIKNLIASYVLIKNHY